MSILNLLYTDFYHTQPFNPVEILNRKETHNQKTHVTTPGFTQFKTASRNMCGQVFVRFTDKLFIALQINTHHPIYNLLTQDMIAIHQPNIANYIDSKVKRSKTKHDVFYYNDVPSNIFVDEFAIFYDFNNFKELDDLKSFKNVYISLDNQLLDNSQGFYIDLRDYTNILTQLDSSDFETLILKANGVNQLRIEDINLMIRLAVETINYLDETTLK